MHENKSMKATIIAASVLTTAFTLSAQNLLSNGSFETGDFTDWTAGGDVVVSSAEGASDGIYDAVFNAGNTLPNGVVSQSFTTTPGIQYSLKFDYGTFGSGGVPQKLDVEVSGNSTLLDTSATSPSVGNPTPFGQFSFSFTADNTSSLLQFTDDSANDTSSKDGELDHVQVDSLQATPEPNAALLAVFGSLFLATFAKRRL
jgi:hypothetical protein